MSNFNSEKHLIELLPTLLNNSLGNSFKVCLLFKNESGKISIDKELDFKNANDQFEYLWSLSPGIELFYISTSLKAKRICYKGNNTSIAFDKINGKTQMILFEENNTSIKNKSPEIAIQSSVASIGKLLNQGRK